MGYGYAETFLIVFLTHPGVILPTISTAVSKFSSYVPPQFSSLVPSGGAPPTASALWQMLWVWILSLPGEKSAGFGWTMYTIYIVFLLLYMYFFLALRMSVGV
jgi:hypothetical protein